MKRKNKDEFLQELSFDQLKGLAKEVNVVDIKSYTQEDLLERLRWFSYRLLVKRYKKVENG